MVTDHTSLRRRPPFKLGGAALGSALLLFFAACYSPDLSFDDCMLPCLKDCPTGAECRNNFCVHTGSSATCAAGGSGGSGGSAAAGTGGDDSGIGGSSEPMAGSPGDTAGAAGESGGATPFKVESAPLSSLCPGQAFQVELSAQGGVAPYTWALADGTPTDIKLSATTGDEVQVSGVATASEPNLELKVRDASGASLTPSVALAVDAVGPGLCPHIVPTHLPDPCDENSYYTNDVTVSGGTAPFVWQAISLPAGLSFDPSKQTLTGTALASGATTPLTLMVTDHKGRQTQMTYPLAYRDKCWLGFTSTEASISKVHLFDPALAARAPALEASTNNTGVVDFKFSPDGKFLAYRRLTGTSGAQSLVLAIAPHWQEQVLDIAGSVVSYSWSQSSSALAVAFKNDTDTMLGGVNVSNASAATSGSGISGVQTLTPVVMIDPASAPLSSELIWLQSDAYLAFHADGLPGFNSGADSPYSAQFDGTAFSSVTQLGFNLYDPTVQLLPAYKGLFAVSPETHPVLDFYGSADGTVFDGYLRTVYISAVADPAGRYVAIPVNEKLQVYLTAESGGTTDPPTAWQPSADDCTSILAWDVSRERLACDARGIPPDGGSPLGEVRLFDLAGTDSTPQVSSSAVKMLAGYQQGDSLGHRRSFSMKGKWLAFTTDTGLQVGSVEEAPHVLLEAPLPPGVPASATSELAFSPDETTLLWLVGGALGVVPLHSNAAVGWYGAALPLQSPEPCNEEFTAGPATWCGRLQTSGSPAWSSDSRFAAVNTAAHGVRVYNLERYDIGAVPYADACETGCDGSIAFQP